MDESNLKAELEQVSSELAAAMVEYASLGATIAGLEARRAALARSVSRAVVPSQGGVEIVGKYRTDDIVEVLMAAGTEMSINDVVAALHAAGRPHETYENVSADLAYLVSSGRAQRVRRGLYASIDSDEPGGDATKRRVIPITQGNITHAHLHLRRHLDFFPADSIGGTSKEAGQGKFLTLHFEGLSDPVETDIASDKKFLRDRTALRRFFKLHSLRAGDKVAIERKAEYEYSLSLVR